MEVERNKQTEIYEFLKSHTENKGYPPSVREICEAVSLRSTSTVHGHLKRLEKKGMIKREKTKPRALEIGKISISKQDMIDIPIIDKITDSTNILAPENIIGTFSLPVDYIKNDKDLFMVRVFGQSMVNVGIRNNDLVIIAKNESVINDDIIAISIDETTIIRRFFKEKDHIRLEPENDGMQPIITDMNSCRVLGKAIGTFRSFE